MATTIDWVKLELDLTTFDASPHREVVRRVAATDIELTTLDRLGVGEAELRRLYELNMTCSADIPGRGTFHTWDEYRRARIDVESFDPRGIVIARTGSGDDAEWIGMAGLSAHPARGHLFGEMTGVRRPFRRTGLATAMKIRSFDFARQFELTTLRTVHHPGNTAMVELNRRLGYVDATWAYPSPTATPRHSGSAADS